MSNAKGFIYQEHKDSYIEALNRLIEKGEVTNEEVTPARETFDIKELLKASIAGV